MHAMRSLTLWACALWPSLAYGQQPLCLPQPMRHVFVGSFLQTAQDPTVGSIVDASFDNMIIRPGDHVRVRCAAACAASVGDELFTFAKSTSIKHPVSHRALGHLTEATGLLRVTQVLPGGLWAEVVSSVMEIERGQSVALLSGSLYQDVLPKRPKVAAQGRVVAIGQNLLLGREERLLFVDLGQKNGMEVGDVLTILGRRDTVHPPLKSSVHKEDVAQIVLVAVNEGVSTAVIADGLWEITLGDGVVASP